MILYGQQFVPYIIVTYKGCAVVEVRNYSTKKPELIEPRSRTFILS